jgi:uncharacterized lipoprotein YehR (DUF1307 family)
MMIALMAIVSLVACGQTKPLTPDEIHQQQNAIITEVGQTYGFPDASINLAEDAKPTIKDGEITTQEVIVRIGEQRPGDVGECHAIVVWRGRNNPPDLQAEGANKMLIQVDTNYKKVEENKDILGFTGCFAH